MRDVFMPHHWFYLVTGIEYWKKKDQLFYYTSECSCFIPVGTRFECDFKPMVNWK